MDKDLNKKFSALDPRFRKKVEELFDTIIESFSSLYEVATHDEKTGLYNNKFFETIFAMEIEKAKRGTQELSLIITDIDFFKKINDTHGHMKADELLLELAKVMQKVIRKSDILARFGGEEFILLLPETSLTKAKTVAEKIRNAVHKDKILRKYKVNVSGGITAFRNKSDSIKAMKIRVDKALYLAKESGRDKFCDMK